MPPKKESTLLKDCYDNHAQIYFKQELCPMCEALKDFKRILKSLRTRNAH